jgi:hypothetical protein
MYLAVLYWVWCLYHSYVGKVIRVKILWHHNGPFGSSSCRSSCLFKGARPSLSGLMCCPCLLRMLGFDHSYTIFSFLPRWLFYFLWCNGTCKKWYLSLPSCTIGYLCNVTWGHPITHFSFRKFSSVVLSSNVVFFNGPTTWVGTYFASSRCSFRCCVHTSSFLCKFNNRGLVISSSQHPFVLFILHPCFYSIPYLS